MYVNVAHVYTYTHTHTHMYEHAHTHTHVRARTHTHTHTHMHARMHLALVVLDAVAGIGVCVFEEIKHRQKLAIVRHQGFPWLCGACVCGVCMCMYYIHADVNIPTMNTYMCVCKDMYQSFRLRRRAVARP